MNPPFVGIAKWIRKLKWEYMTGRVTEAIALLPVYTDTRWFADLDEYPRCFIRGRLRFRNRSVKQDTSPFASCLVYLGTNVRQFVDATKDVGSVFVRLVVPDAEKSKTRKKGQLAEREKVRV